MRAALVRASCGVGFALTIALGGCASSSVEGEVERLRATVNKLQQESQAARQDAAKSAEAAKQAQAASQSAEQQATTAAKAANAAADRADRIYQSYIERR